MEVENKTFWYAMMAIAVVAIVYSVDSRIGLLLAGVIILAGLGNMYAAGVIKPASGGTT